MAFVWCGSGVALVLVRYGDVVGLMLYWFDMVVCWGLVMVLAGCWSGVDMVLSWC